MSTINLTNYTQPSYGVAVSGTTTTSSSVGKTSIWSTIGGFFKSNPEVITAIGGAVGAAVNSRPNNGSGGLLSQIFGPVELAPDDSTSNLIQQITKLGTIALIAFVAFKLLRLFNIFKL